MNFYKKYIREHAFVFWFCVILWLISFFCGIKTVFDLSDRLYMETADYLKALQESAHPIADIIKNGILLNCKLFLLSALCIYSAIFIPLSICMICFKGFSAGFTVSYLVNTLGYEAYKLILMSVAVPMFFSLPVCFLLFTTQITQPLKYNKVRKMSEYLSALGILLFLYLILMIINILEAFISPYAFSFLK